MNVRGTCGATSSGTANLEGNDVRDLREIALSEGHGCARRYLLHPSNSQRPPAETKRKSGSGVAPHGPGAQAE